MTTEKPTRVRLVQGGDTYVGSMVEVKGGIAVFCVDPTRFETVMRGDAAVPLYSYATKADAIRDGWQVV